MFTKGSVPQLEGPGVAFLLALCQAPWTKKRKNHPDLEDCPHRCPSLPNLAMVSWLSTPKTLQNSTLHSLKSL